MHFSQEHLNIIVVCKQSLQGTLAAGQKKEGELASKRKAEIRTKLNKHWKTHESTRQG